MQNLRGLSEIISALLIISLAIVAISLLVVVADNLSSRLSPEFSCLELQLRPPITIKRACFNSTTLDTQATLERNLDDTFLASIEFTLDNQAYSCGPSCGGNCHILNSGNSQTYYFQQKADQITISSSGCILNAKEITIC
jgi:hypothetical protein